MEKKDYLFWLFGYRATLAGLALFFIATRSFDTMLVALAALGVLLVIGEAVYKSWVAFEEQRLRAQRERELREQRAEEARLRLEAFKQAQQESAEKYMIFQNEVPAEEMPSTSPAAAEVVAVK